MAVMQGVAEMNHERAERDSQRIVLSLDVLWNELHVSKLELGLNTSLKKIDLYAFLN